MSQPYDSDHAPEPATQLFFERWRSMEMVGAAAPFQKIEIRKGRFRRWFDPWPPPSGWPEGRYNRHDYGEGLGGAAGTAWQATWEALSDWVEIPGLAQVTTSADIGQGKGTATNGVSTATIIIENTRLKRYTGPMGQLYHLWDRGYLSPWRGLKTPSRSPVIAEQNDWFERLARNAQIRIWQGYGEHTAVITWTGLIDDVDFDSGGGTDTATITARDFGRTLTDQRVFLWCKDPSINDPITFADRKSYHASNTPMGVPPPTGANKWILVDDVSDIVRIVLRWAGFKKWNVENTGVRLLPRQPTTFNRSAFLIDIINELKSVTGFVFFIDRPDPDDPDSLGIPTWRFPRSLVDLKDVLLIHDTHLLTEVKATVSDQDRAYLIRVRGKMPGINDIAAQVIAIAEGDTGFSGPMPDDTGLLTTLGGDRTQRPMYSYRPPWTRAQQEAGIIKHVTHTDDRLLTLNDCRIACFLIAAEEALSAYTAQATCSGNPMIALDTHVAILDHGTGMSTRVWITNVTSRFVWGADQAGGSGGMWETTFQGALLDTPDTIAIKKELNDANLAGFPLVKAPFLRG